MDAFDAAALAEAGVDKAIKERGAEISELVTQANAKYAAKHGHDLFKPTNKTVEALLRVARPVRNEDGYCSLVDDLYFVFHEGPGNRLGNDPPVSLSDVNILRTDLRDDVDHGNAGKVRAKKKKGGAAFKKYSGVESPAGLAPERFAVVQLNILDALKQDLTQVVESL